MLDTAPRNSEQCAPGKGPRRGRAAASASLRRLLEVRIKCGLGQLMKSSIYWIGCLLQQLVTELRYAPGKGRRRGGAAASAFSRRQFIVRIRYGVSPINKRIYLMDWVLDTPTGYRDTYICVYIHTCMYACTHASMQACMHVYINIHICIHKYTNNIYIYILVYIHICLYI